MTILMAIILVSIYVQMATFSHFYFAIAFANAKLTDIHDGKGGGGGEDSNLRAPIGRRSTTVAVNQAQRNLKQTSHSMPPSEETDTKYEQCRHNSIDSAMTG